MYVFSVMCFILLLLSVVWAIMTPGGRVGDGGFLPSGGTGSPTPSNFATPNTLLFLHVRTSFPGFTRTNSSFRRVSQVTMPLTVFAEVLSVFSFSAKCVMFILGVCVLVFWGLVTAKHIHLAAKVRVRRRTSRQSSTTSRRSGWPICIKMKVITGNATLLTVCGISPERSIDRTASAVVHISVVLNPVISIDRRSSPRWSIDRTALAVVLFILLMILLSDPVRDSP